MSEVIKIAMFAETRKKVGNRTIHRKQHWDVCVQVPWCVPETKPARRSGQKRDRVQQFSHKHLSALFFLWILINISLLLKKS